ncbi:MAG: emp24/gp25L/p24 family protein [Caldilineaceae bacterium]|nr:emp24/gp25L/p24 family protein [Caldilineaceae bacterium]
MSDQSIIIAPEFESPVAERNALWADYDHAQGNAAKLRTLRGRVPHTAQANSLEPLTSAGDIPNELSTAVQKLESELAAIERLQTSIRSNEDSIREIEAHYRTMVMWSIIAVVVIIVIVILMLL